VRLLEKFKPRLVDFAMHMIRDRETAEDIAQETFLRVLRAKDTYRPIAKFSTWIHTITTNLCYDELRKHRRQVSLESMLGHPPTAEDQLFSARSMRRHPVPRPDAQAEQKELADLVDDIIESLSRQHRDVIVMRIREGLGYAEIAQRAGCPTGTAKSRMHHAMKKVRDELMRRM